MRGEEVEVARMERAVATTLEGRAFRARTWARVLEGESVGDGVRSGWV